MFNSHSEINTLETELFRSYQEQATKKPFHLSFFSLLLFYLPFISLFFHKFIFPNNSSLETFLQVITLLATCFSGFLIFTFTFSSRAKITESVVQSSIKNFNQNYKVNAKPNIGIIDFIHLNFYSFGILFYFLMLAYYFYEGYAMYFILNALSIILLFIYMFSCNSVVVSTIAKMWEEKLAKSNPDQTAFD